MRTLLTIAALALLAIPAHPQVSGGSVQGTVKVGETGEPLKEAQVSLLRRIVVTPVIIGPNQTLMPASLVPASPPVPNVLTDEHGHFEFSQVPPGDYLVSVRRMGYVSLRPWDGIASPTAAETVHIDAGRATGIELKMNRAGSIHGIVTAPGGIPASDFRVIPYMFVFENGRRAILGGRQVVTDGSGHYEIPQLGPGDYIIGASAPLPALRNSAVAPVAIDHRPTFYPSTPEPLSAATVQVKGGDDRSEINIQIPKVKTYTIRGRALNPLPQPAMRTFPNGDRDFSIPNFGLMPRGASVMNLLLPQIPNAVTTEAGRRNGDFEIRNVLPGLYDLFPVARIEMDGEARYASGRIAVEVTDHNVEGIVLTPEPGVDIQGKILISGNANGVKLDSLRVELESSDNSQFLGQILPQPVSADGKFRIRYVPEAHYNLLIQGLPDNTYIEDIRSGRTSVFDSGLDVGRTPPPPVDVVINTNGKSLEGTVSTGKPQVVVVLVPEPAHRKNGQRNYGAITGNAGHFELSGISPGKYRIFAWENVLSTAWQNPEFMLKYEQFGRDIQVNSKNLRDIMVTVIGKDQ